MPPPEQERRSTRRFPMQVPVIICADGEIAEVQGVTRDISAEGVFFQVPEWPRKESAITFRIIVPKELTQGPPIRALCQGHVLRIEPDPSTSRTGIAASIETYAFGK